MDDIDGLAVICAEMMRSIDDHFQISRY